MHMESCENIMKNIRFPREEIGARLQSRKKPQIRQFGVSLQADLVGNRAIACNTWAVITAIERAFPLLISNSLDLAKETAANIGAEGNASFLQNTWILQVNLKLGVLYSTLTGH